MQASKINFKQNNSKKKDNNNDENENRYNKEDFEKFISIKWDKCKPMYFCCLFCHLYSLLLNIAIFFVLDFFLQQRFLLYVPKIWPMTRDPEGFSDVMSKEFYHFSRCQVPSGRLVFGRTEHLQCYLTLMEYYEKIFVFIWFYLLLLFIF